MPQMQEMKQENSILAQKLRQQERELAALRHIGADRPMSGTRGDAKENKIVELAKKNRSLIVSFEKERAKNGRMAAEIAR